MYVWIMTMDEQNDEHQHKGAQGDTQDHNRLLSTVACGPCWGQGY